MTIRDITAIIEQAVPLYMQEHYDNSGLIVGHYGAEVDSVLLCVDITPEVISEAEREGCGLVISHHPVIFNPIKKLTGSSNTEELVETAIKKGIALYACHTNLDSVEGGTSYRLAVELGIGQLEVLDRAAGNLKNDPVCGERIPDGEYAGFGVTGTLPEPIPTIDYLRFVKEKLGLKVIRHNDICSEKVLKISVCTGSGGSLIEKAAAAGADLYISADFRYNNFLDAQGRLTVADIGHYESEYCAIDLLYDIITKKLPTFAVRKSKETRNPVNYLV